MSHLADFAAEADLAEGDQVGRQREIADGAHDGETQGEVETWLDQPHATDRGGVDVVDVGGYSRPLLQHCQQQCQAVAVDALRGAPCRHARAETTW